VQFQLLLYLKKKLVIVSGVLSARSAKTAPMTF